MTGEYSITEDSRRIEREDWYDKVVKTMEAKLSVK